MPKEAKNVLSKAPAHNNQNKNLNFCSIAQEVMLSCVDVSQLTVYDKALASRHLLFERINEVLDKDTA